MKWTLWHHRFAIGVAALVMAAGLVAPASAATFNFTQQGGFTFGSEVSANFGYTQFFQDIGIEFFDVQPDVLPGTQYGTIGWGGNSSATPSFVTNVDPFVQPSTSALRVETLAGQITDNGTFVTVAVLTHDNSPIDPVVLSNVTIDTLLSFFDGATPVDIGPGALGTVPITFRETNNFQACDPDIQIIGTPPCSDFFVFPLAGFFTPLTFTHEGVDYTVTFRLVPLAGAIFETVDCANPAGPPVDPETFEGDLCGRIRTAEGSTNQIAIQMALTSEEEPTNACPRTQGYWKNHPGHIDLLLEGLAGLSVGGELYTRAELVTILKTPPKGGNAILILIHQLIATKLNLLAGADPDPILQTVIAADVLLDGFDPLSDKVKTSSNLGQQMIELKDELDAFNNGADTPNCTPFRAIK